MGSYNFRWEHPAEEVYVTGTFDNWSKSVKLDKKDLVHEKMVNLPPSEDKILYKFVADGEWKTDHTVKSEKDHEGNVNNVLYPDDFKPPVSQAATISSVGAGATTLGLAGAQPKETRSTTPGAFPETPADEGQNFAVAPLPATEGFGNPVQLAPGEKVPDPSTFTSNTVDSTVTTDQESYERGGAGIVPVQPNPLSDPTAAGLGPVTESTIPESSLGMGKDAPADINSVDIGPTVSSVGAGATTLGLAGQVPKEPRGTARVVEDDDDDETKDTSAEEKKEDGGVSSAAIGGLAAAGAAVAGGAVAANEYLKDKTGTDAKSALPESAQQKIDEAAQSKDAPTTSATSTAAETSTPVAHTDDTAVAAAPTGSSEAEKPAAEEAKKDDNTKKDAGIIAATGATVAGGAIAANEYIKDKTGKDPQSALPESTQQKVNETAKSADPPASSYAAAPSSTAVKNPVTDKSTAAKDEKTNEKKDAGYVAAAGATAAGGALAANEYLKDKTGTDPKSSLPESTQQQLESAAAPTTTTTDDPALPQQTSAGEAPKVPAEENAARETTSSVPEEVVASQKESHTSPEATANPEAVKEKSAVEDELLAKVPTSNAQGEPAPTVSAATASTAPAPTSASGAPQLADPTAGVSAMKLTDDYPNKVEDVSPLSPADTTAKDPSSAGTEAQTSPIVTTGVASAPAPATSSAAAAVATPRKNLGGKDNSQKRQSFVDRLKGTPESSKSAGTVGTADTTGKKEKRKSLFGRIKEKLKA